MQTSFGIAKTRITPPPKTVEAFRPIEPGGFRFIQLVAGAGYGKSTLLVDLMDRAPEGAVYALLTPFESDQYQLVLLLAAAFSRVVELPAELAEETAWRSLADALINRLPEREIFVVLDDLHFLEDKPAVEALDYLLRFLPRSYRFVLAGRTMPAVPALRQARLRGQACLLDSQDLRLSFEQIVELCEGDEARAQELEKVSGGWPLACSYLANREGQWEQSTDDLEELILDDIWQQLEPDLREFLTLCSVLEFLTAEECQELTGRQDSKELLRRFSREGVFVTPQAEGLRLHPLVQEYLQRQLQSQPQLAERAYRNRAEMLIRQERLVQAVPFLIEVGEVDRAVALIKSRASVLLKSGRHGLLLKALESLPVETDRVLCWLRAEASRQAGDFERSTLLYSRVVEMARESHDHLLESLALAGKAQISIDTVCPTEAAHLLHQAYRALPQDAREQKAQVLRLLAENAINSGQARGARRYLSLASRLSEVSPEPQVEARLLLRTGRLRQAWEATERALVSGKAATGQAGHRDEHLLLSYLAALMGQPEQACERARRGLAAAREQGATLTQAVAKMRLAHGLGLEDEPDVETVKATYGEARALARRSGVARLEAEILMGEALLEAAWGSAADAYQLAGLALELTEQAGDAWLTAWLRLTLGIAAHQGQRDEAPELLRQARREMERCKDQFGQRVAGLWQAMAEGGDLEAWKRKVEDRGYEFLLERPTLFGPRGSLREATPAKGWRIAALGPMRVFRGQQELSSKDFKRRKARELLALFLASAESPCPRDQLMETLWPEATRKAALRDFRVALHALSDALEPGRAKNTTAAPIERREEVYTFRLAEVDYDVSEFEELVSQIQRGHDSVPALERALALYRGDFLEDYPYLDWCAPHRERLRQAYLETAERLAHVYLEQERFEQASELAHAMLGRDRCWEEAYRILMRSHLGSERPFLAARVYDQCAEVLQAELGVPPSDETEELLALTTA